MTGSIGVPKGRGKMLTALPYDGPRWYSREATQWLMRAAGWVRPQVTWDDIKFKYSSTAHLPADFFRQPIEEIEASIPELAKQAVNSLLGLWSLDEHTSWMVSVQADEYLVLPHADKVMVREAPGGVDVAYRQTLLHCSSMRPIVHQVLDRELTMLGQLHAAL